MKDQCSCFFRFVSVAQLTHNANVSNQHTDRLAVVDFVHLALWPPIALRVEERWLQNDVPDPVSRHWWIYWLPKDMLQNVTDAGAYSITPFHAARLHEIWVAAWARGVVRPPLRPYCAHIVPRSPRQSSCSILAWGIMGGESPWLTAVTCSYCYCNFKGWIFDQNQKQGSEGPMKFPSTS